MDPTDYFFNGMFFGLGLAAGLGMFIVVVICMASLYSRRFGYWTVETRDPTKCRHGYNRQSCLRCKLEI